MKSKIKAAIQKLRLLNDDKEIENNLILWSFIKFFTGHQRVKQAAAALTYHTLFAIVPVMALMIAVAKLLGYGDAFRAKIDVFFAGQESIASGLLGFVDSYLSNRDTNYMFGAIVGLTLLLYSVFSIFQTVDSSFNSLWNLKAHSLKKQIKVFLFVLLVPFVTILLLAIWISISSFFNSGGVLHEVNIFVLTTGIYIAILFVAYKFIPNTKVNIRHAATAATFCGVVFAIMQYSGSLILGMFSNYRNIYGDLASLMLFILWIYFSWTICLAGSRWNYLLQEGYRLDAENKFKGLSYNYRKFLTTLAIKRCKVATDAQKSPFTIQVIADEMSTAYDIPVYTATEILDTMERKGIIIANDDEQYTLDRRFAHCSDKDIADTLDRAGNNDTTALVQRLDNEEKELWTRINS